jgi:hypothetical protein
MLHYFEHVLIVIHKLGDGHFIARGYGLAAPSARLLWANLFALLGRPSLIRVCWVLFGAWLLGRSNYDCIWLVKFPPLLHIHT